MDQFRLLLGHSTGSGGYHYHFPPSCLLAQATHGGHNDSERASRRLAGHKTCAQIGWARGRLHPIFRADGPLGPGGVEIRNCGASGADATYCQDACGGYEGELDGVDNYKYRYYVTGKVGDLNALPSNPKPDSETLYFPYTIRCHRGATVSEYNSVSGSNGYTSAHTATAHPGYELREAPGPVPRRKIEGRL